MEDSIKKGREFLKDTVRMRIDFTESDQNREIAPPPVEKEYNMLQKRITLSKPEQWKNIKEYNLISAIGQRKSYRRFLEEPLSLEELSFLLWAAQGVRKISRAGVILRNVPSAGNRHAFETYVAILNIKGVEKGIYRYLPVEHELVFEFEEENLSEKISVAAMGQFFVGSAPVVFFWTAIPYRMEWRYREASYKAIAIDAGHVCQNLYIACEAIEAGTCAIGAYNQDLMDELLRVDGNDEFVIYLAPAGKIKKL